MKTCDVDAVLRFKEAMDGLAREKDRDLKEGGDGTLVALQLAALDLAAVRRHGIRYDVLRRRVEGCGNDEERAVHEQAALARLAAAADSYACF